MKRGYRNVAFDGTCSFSHHTIRPPFLRDDCLSGERERRPIELTYREVHISVIRSQWDVTGNRYDSGKNIILAILVRN
jgi:hypothetical protein